MSVEGDLITQATTMLSSLVGTQGDDGKVVSVRREHASGLETLAYPYILIEVPMDRQADAFGKDHTSVILRVHLYQQRDRDGTQAKTDTIVTAIQTALKDQTPSPSVSWSYSPLVRLRGFRGPSTSQSTHRIEEYATTATAATGG